MKWTYIFSVMILFSCTSPQEKIFIPKDIVIAHRGSTYWTPEETEAAYRWARNMGADYLEVDIQRTKDGVLLALHDPSLERTTNAKKVFQDTNRCRASDFTYEEMMQLDAGVWFNVAYPERARLGYTPSLAKLKATDRVAVSFTKDGKVSDSLVIQETYIGGKQYVSTLEDVIRIAEGYCIARDSLGNRLYKTERRNGKLVYHFYYVKDPKDSEDRPGVYIETKEPDLFPGVEKDLFQHLQWLGWNVLTKPVTDTILYRNAKVRVGKTSAKVILQTFSPHSLKNLYAEFKGRVPTTLLLWQGDANMPHNDSVSYFENLKLAHDYGAQIIGPSIGGFPNNYDDLLTEENFQWIRGQGFIIHPYSFDTEDQTKIYGKRCDGMFTNRTDLTSLYYYKQGRRQKIVPRDAEKVLSDLEY